MDPKGIVLALSWLIVKHAWLDLRLIETWLCNRGIVKLYIPMKFSVIYSYMLRPSSLENLMLLTSYTQKKLATVVVNYLMAMLHASRNQSPTLTKALHNYIHIEHNLLSPQQGGDGCIHTTLPSIHTAW